MDLLGGYGSGSDSDGEPQQAPPALPPRPALNAAPAAVPRTRGSAALFGRLPAPRDAAPAAATNGSGGSGDGLPADFFDASSGANGAPAAGSGPASSLPAGFFDTAAPAPGAPPAPAARSEPPAGPVRPRGANPALADLPLPRDEALWSRLPAASSRRRVVLRPAVNLALLAASDSDDEEGPAAKRAKQAAPAAAGGKPSVLSFLPAPKNAPSGGGSGGSSTRLAVGGSGGGTGSGEDGAARAGSSAQQGGDAAAAAAAAASNEAYRVRPAPAPAAAAGGEGGEQEQQYDAAHYAAWQAYYAQQQQYADYQQQAGASGGQAAAGRAGGGGKRPQAEALAPEEAFLQEALQAEAAKAARRAAGTGSSQLVMPDIQFKEVKADSIKYADAARREAAQGMRGALGSDYAAQLRAQAAPHLGSRLARSKHQIGTLFANAKLRELEVMENRASGMKSKAETAGKYGW